jgi:type II secretory pathway pseudopilin PulG
MGARKPLRLAETGWTLVELMLVTALIGIITPAMTLLFTKVSQGMAADEMHTQIMRGNSYLMSRLETRLSANKHFFQGGSAMGASFVAAVSFVSAPSTVAGTQLAQAQTSTSGSFDPTSTGFQSSYIGNSLFFAAYDSPQTTATGGVLQTTYAPLTVAGTGVTDSFGTPMTLIIDLYRFYYYYLTPSTHPLAKTEGVTAYGLEEWQSVQYPDCGELTSIPDNTLQNNAVSFIVKKGYTTAWDSSQQAVTQAFYTLSYFSPPGSSPAGFTQITSPHILQAAVTYLCQVPSGILSRGFAYGISPNSSGWKNAPVSVPKYATASGQFPGGFEVGISGPPGGRQILIHSVWVAKGASPRFVFNDLNSIESIRDQW